MPSTSTNFEGVNNIDGVLPPDTNGDVGPNNYVQWVNLQFEVFDRTGTGLLGPSQGNTLWAGFGGVCDTTNQGDPVVRYDRMANRWVFTQFAFNLDRRGNPIAPFVQCFAVSTSGDPTGTYYRYAWTISNSYFADYPKLAVWPDAYYMTVNFFNGLTFVGGGALAFDRSKMLSGQPATGIGFGPLGVNYGGLLPSDLDGSILPPSGSPNYFGAIDAAVSPSGSTFQIWKFHVDFTTPANSTFGVTTSHTPNFNLAVATYFWNMCNSQRSCIQQPGTNQGLDPISDRLMNRLQYRRFADGHESLVANHTVGVGSGNNQAAIRWYEIRNLSTAPTIYQQSTYAPGTDSRWMGSIAMDQSGDIALGYSVSSSTVSPSIRYTGRLASDPLASLPQGEATLIAGSGSQTSGFNRWGDYSMMAVDPTDDCIFWYTQEYYTVTSDRGWQTRVGSFKFPNCAPPLTISSVQASNMNSSSAVITWQTNNPANSRVDYGGTTAYGVSVADSANVFNHSVALSGLTNNTTYHFSSTSTDAYGQNTSSHDGTFATSTNLLINGGFESGINGWSLAPQASIDTNPTNAHLGNTSLKLIATAGWQGTAQHVAISPGQSYSFTGWGRSTGSGGTFTIYSFDASGTFLYSTYFSFAGTGTWAQAAGTYVAASTTASIDIVPQSVAAGTFWFDDVDLLPTSNLVANGGFELGSVAWNLAPQASLDANPADAHSGNNSLKLMATSGWQGTAQHLAISPGQAYGFTGWGRSTGSGGTFTIYSFDASGTFLSSAYFSFAGTGSWVPAAGTYVAPSSATSIDLLPQSVAPGTFWFDDIALAPTNNLVANGGFELASAGWNVASQASLDTNPADAHSGNNSLKLVATTGWQGSSEHVAINAGQSYSLTGWGRSTSGGGTFTIYSFDANGAFLSSAYFSFAGTGSWVLVAGTYVAPSRATSIDIVPQSVASGTFWFDDVSLAHG
jgi:hypothetical protein